MNKFACATFAAAALSTATVHAQDYYAGIATGTSGKAHLRGPTGPSIENDNHPHPVKVYGGYQFTPNYALEAGYGDFGSYTFHLGGTEQRFDTSALYVAGKASMALGDAFTFFGKAGVARSRVASIGFGSLSGTETSLRPMFGVGADYKLSQNVALTLEYERLGTVRNAIGPFKQNHIEAGVKVSF